MSAEKRATTTTPPIRAKGRLFRVSLAGDVLPMVLAVALTIVRIVLAYQTPVTVLLGAGTEADDRLFANAALYLAAGKWLGPYGRYTLAKNPGYPMIIALCGTTHIRYQLFFIGAQAIACLAFAIALRPRIRPRWVRVVVYLILLYTPLLFTTTYFRRIYRDGMVIPFAILSLSAYIGWYLRRKGPVRGQLPWSAAAVLGLVPLSLIKENFTWVLPFVLVCSIVMAVGWLKGARREHQGARGPIVRVALLVLPLVLVWSASEAVSRVNYERYCFNGTNERFTGSFARVCSDLSGIDTGEKDEGLWVSRKALESAMGASPTLATIRESVEGSWDEWDESFDGHEVYGDLAYWALRQGYYDARKNATARTASAFWSKVDAELRKAEGTGNIGAKGGLRISQVAPPVGTTDLLPWARRTLDTSATLLRLDALQEHLIEPGWKPVSPPGMFASGEVKMRVLLGGNTLANGEVDDTSKKAAAVSAVDYHLGRVGIAAMRIMNLLLLPAIAALVAMAVRGRVKQPVESLLIALGLALTALAYEAATVWYVSYQLSVFSFDSYLLEVGKYSPEFYVVISMLECLIFAELAGLEHKHAR
ncbi:hypothetical protein [Parafannyhessea umbonata]|uniref:hypothetical protein n=1 Tax=Parafannyhessea umbonata TaxID=604330 RepID=UPI00359C3667